MEQWTTAITTTTPKWNKMRLNFNEAAFECNFAGSSGILYRMLTLSTCGFIWPAHFMPHEKTEDFFLNFSDGWFWAQNSRNTHLMYRRFWFDPPLCVCVCLNAEFSTCFPNKIPKLHTNVCLMRASARARHANHIKPQMPKT